MVNKKGQFKIQQMIFMLIAVMMFFVLVGLLIVTVKFSGLKEQATELAEKNAKLLVTKLANSPEFSCAQELISVSCIDFDKAMALKNNIKKYEKFWGVSKIEIKKIYPKETEKKCTSQNYPNCNVIELMEESEGICVENFVSLCRKDFDSESDKLYNKCEIGIISTCYKEVL